MKCCIDIADGIGNVIQAIPFYKAMREKYDVIIGHDRPDYPETRQIVKNFFDDFVPRGKIPKGIKYYPIPNLHHMGSVPEHKSWFIWHKEMEPEEYDCSGVCCNTVNHDFDVVIWPGCKKGWKTKQWPYWEEVFKLLRESNLEIAIVGTKDDAEDMEFDTEFDFRGKLSLTDTGGVIAHSTVFVGNEGGISHYSAAIGTETLIVYGGSDPVKNMPPKNATRIACDIVCQPCQFKTDNPAIGCGQYVCLRELLPSKVVAQVIGALDV